MRISQAQAQALATFVSRIRTDWDHPGIVAAIQRAAAIASPADIGVALCRLAANPDLRTPAILPDPGTHWQGTLTGSRPAPVMCPDHPTWKASACTDSGPCRAASDAADHAAGVAAVKAALRAGPRVAPIVQKPKPSHRRPSQEATS